jgi:hypothetical protein
MSNTIYTPEVIAYADRVMEVLEDGLHPETKKNFFEAEFTTPDRGRRLFREILSDQATANFLEREDNAVQMTLEQMQGVMKESIIRGSLEELRETQQLKQLQYIAGIQTVKEKRQTLIDMDKAEMAGLIKTDEQIGKFLITKFIREKNIYYNEKTKRIFLYNEKLCIFEEDTHTSKIMVYISNPIISLIDKKLETIDLDNNKKYVKSLNKLRKEIQSTPKQKAILTQIINRLPNNSKFIENTFNNIPFNNNFFCTGSNYNPERHGVTTETKRNLLFNFKRRRHITFKRR